MTIQASQLAVIVTCKGRLEHLQVTAPRVIESGKVGSYVLVDWGCPDESGAWLSANYPSATVVKTMAEGFEKTRAANLGARRAMADGAEYLLFLDADTLVAPEFLDWVLENANPDEFLISPGSDERGLRYKNLVGVLCLPSTMFAKSEGFDPQFGASYGHEDMDLRLRLHFQFGCGYRMLPPQFLSSGALAALPHGDELRTRYYSEKEVSKNVIMTMLLLASKFFRYTGIDFATAQASAGMGKRVNELVSLSVH